MNISKQLLAAAALVASLSTSASAQVVGALGGGVGPYLSLSAPAGTCTGANCTLGPGVGTISGGNIYVADLPFADIPAGVVFQNRFLAAGPTSTSPATLTFTTPLRYISFLWGSPDPYNVLTVNYNGGSSTFTAMGLGFPVVNGSQSVSQYVQFTADPGFTISSLVFNNSPQIDAFEVANFTTNQVVPEPSTYALMAAGLAALGFVSKRRRRA